MAGVGAPDVLALNQQISYIDLLPFLEEGKAVLHYLRNIEVQFSLT